MNRTTIRRWTRSLVIHARPFVTPVLRLFFHRKYLCGRHFDPGVAGFVWALSSIWTRNILRLAKPLEFPASHRASISTSRNLEFHPDDLNNFQSPGIYLQNFAATIRIGRGTYIAPNVGIITANHDPLHLDRHLPGADVTLGERCWIGMNAIILPGVTLGPGTIVGAGSVVTRSFPDGHCIIAGNPARIVKLLNSETVSP